jgi:hypothetical protein|tara:strand:+ start:2117 stop:2329 length:213 start_codon:yes stop_codon:yes gene_type:complete
MHGYTCILYVYTLVHLLDVHDFGLGRRDAGAIRELSENFRDLLVLVHDARLPVVLALGRQGRRSFERGQV